jgi:hypothetical protein
MYVYVCICMYSISNKKVLSIIEFLTWAFIYDLGVWVLYVSGMYLHVCDSICMYMYVFWFICWYEIHDAWQQGCMLSVRAPQATVRAPQAQEAPCSTSTPGPWFGQWTTRRMLTEKWTINIFLSEQSVPVCPCWWCVHCCAVLASFAVVLIVILPLTIQIYAYTCKYMQNTDYKKV